MLGIEEKSFVNNTEDVIECDLGRIIYRWLYRNLNTKLRRMPLLETAKKLLKTTTMEWSFCRQLGTHPPVSVGILTQN